VIHDTDGRWAQAWGDVSVTPTTFVVDSSGQIHKRYVGVPDFDGLRRWLSEELPG
jgi:deoxyinosine 3'endonuclease (endonuclease V)